MRSARFKHIYGPVPSRRLGRSLGIDLVPFKTCSYDCLYCQLGRTTNKTVERREYVPVDEILREIEMKLAGHDTPDFVSLAGSGEPTLNSGIGKIIKRIKDISNVPVAVLTNGSLLWMEEVRNELARADVVMPSLDAANEHLFRYVNRPHESITFERTVEGIESFAREFRGETWLESLLLSGVTGTQAEAGKIAAVTMRIRPARVHLNTITRPPAEDFALPVSCAEMSSIRNLFTGRVEVISAAFRSIEHDGGNPEIVDDDVLALIGRRPCTSEDIAAGLGIRVIEALKQIELVMTSGRAGMVMQDGKCFYFSKTVRVRPTTVKEH